MDLRCAITEIPPELWALAGAVFVAFVIYGFIRQQRGDNNEH